MATAYDSFNPPRKWNERQAELGRSATLQKFQRSRWKWRFSSSRNTPGIRIASPLTSLLCRRSLTGWRLDPEVLLAYRPADEDRI